MPRPRLLVIEHQASCPPARLGMWLAEAGVDLEVVRPYLGEPMPEPADLVGPAGVHGLLVLGGSMDAWDPAVPWLVATRHLALEAADLRLPTLGVCLGHQLLALAFGGDVGRSPHGQQVGLGWVRWTADAEHEDVLAPGGEPRHAPQPGVFWNDDVVLREPAGAVVLARNKDGDVQAMRYGPTTWGVQWHPEASAEVLADWAAHDADRHLERGIDQRARLAEVAAARAGLDRFGRGIADRFARRLHEVAAHDPRALG